MDQYPVGQPTPPPNPPVVPPEWAVAAPTASAKAGIGAFLSRRILSLLVVVAVVVVVIIGGIVVDKVFNPNHLGQVLFTTTSQENVSDCSISDTVATVKAGTPIYATYFWTHRLTSDQQVIEEDFKDGVSLGQYSIPSDSSSDADCLSVTSDLSSGFSAPGTYEIKLTVGSEVVADGKITVTP